MVYSTRLFGLCLTLCYFGLVFFSPFSIALPLLGKRELILVLFVRLFYLRLFGFVCFLFLLVPGKGCGSVPRFTETKPKYRNETEIPKRAIKNIGKMLLVSKCLGEMGNEVFS